MSLLSDFTVPCFQTQNYFTIEKLWDELPIPGNDLNIVDRCTCYEHIIINELIMIAVQKKKWNQYNFWQGTDQTVQNYSWPMSLLFTDDINRFCHDDALLSLQLLLTQINSWYLMWSRSTLFANRDSERVKFKTRSTLYFEDKHMPLSQELFRLFLLKW